MKRSDATAALSWANNTRATGDTRITSTEFHVLCVIAGGCNKRADIAAAVGCSESTIPRCVRKLIKIGALERTPNEGKPNDYTVKTRSFDTGVTSDTGITTSRATDDTRSKRSRATKDTGAATDTGQPVDNDVAHIEHAGARGTITNLSTTSELNPEALESSGAVAAREPSLVNQVCDAVNSPYLDTKKSLYLATTGAYIERWKRLGLDLEREIIPAIAAKCESLNGHGRPIGTFKYFDGMMLDIVATNKAAQQDPTHDHPPSTPDSNIRRGRISPLTAARRERKRQRDAEREPIDYGRVDSQRID